jgi:translocation and assembly module TamB
MRWFARTLTILLAIGTLAVALAFTALWTIGSERGTQWLLARALARASPTLTIGAASGSLLGGLDLTDVRVRLTRDELDIPQLHLEWNAAAALAGSAAFRNVRAAPVAYRRLSPNGAPEGGEPFDLPIPVVVEDAVVAGLTIAANGVTVELGEARGAADFTGGRLTLERIVSTWQGLALDGSGVVTLGTAIGLSADVAWSGPLGGVDSAGRLELAGNWPVLRVHHELAAPFTAETDGQLDFQDVMEFGLDSTWTNLAWPAVDHIASSRGRLTLGGTLANYRFESSGSLDVDGRAADFTTRGTAERLELAIEALELAARTDDGEAGVLQGSGAVSLDARTAALAVEARDFDPRWLLPAWPGRLTGTARMQAQAGPTPGARFTAANFAGRLRGHALTLRGDAAVSLPNHWTFDGTRIEAEGSRATIDGTLDASSDDGPIALTVAAADAKLAVLVPGASGSVTAQLEIDGTFGLPHAAGRVEARGLDVAGFKAERLSIAGSAGRALDTPLQLTIEGDRLARGSIVAATVRGDVTGTTRAHRLNMGARADQWLATLGVAGGVDDTGLWNGTIERFELDELTFGQWRLAEPARVSAGVGRVAVETSCVEHVSGGRWCAALDVAGEPSDRLVLSAQNFDLKTLQPLLPPELVVDGVYQLSVSLLDLGGNPHGAAVLTGGTTHARVRFGSAQAFSTNLENLQAAATLRDSRFDLRASVQSGATGKAELSARVDDVRARDSTIGGALHVDWSDLGFLALLSPDLGQIAGTAAIDLTIGGSAQNPEVEGGATWSDGRVAFPAWGLTIDKIAASARSRDGRALEIDATGAVGDGLLKLAGTTTLDPEAGWPTRLKLTGDAVRAVQLPDVEVRVTPDLDVVATLPDVRVTGTVTIPRASIALSELPAQAVAPSPDAVVHGVEQRETVHPLQLSADLMLALGDDVTYSGLNLMTKVTGGIKLHVEPGRSMTANGTLTLAGTYNAYGQTLNLEKGQLLFSGPLDDPGLDVRAVRTVGETAESAQTTVGVELVGSVKAPRTRIFSTPAMSEADALSYLLLGRPVTGTGGEETATLQTAALSMGLQQALPVVRRIGQSLGLDELSVQSTATDAGALMAGKYLSPKVYIRYSYGLFNRIGGLLLRFKVNERLSIETRSGDQKSMDLLYTVEKD